MNTDPTTSKQGADQPLTDQDEVDDESLLLALARENAALKHQVQILESLPDLIVGFDLSGRIFFASQSVLDFLGLTQAKDIEGTSFWELVTFESRVLIRRELDAALAAQKVQGGDAVPLASRRSLMVYVVIKKEGREETHQVSLKGMVHMNEGDPNCICSIRLCANAFCRVDSGAVISVNGDSD